MPMLAIIGPTGNVGAQVADLVVNADPPMEYRLAAHTPQKLRDKYGEETNVVRFDYDDRSTWDAVLKDVDVLFLLFPLPSPRTVNTRMKPFIDAAAAAKVGHIVYVAVPGADTQKIVPHYAVERHIEASGVPYTFLHPTYFMQNLCRKISTHGVDIMDHDEIYIPAKDSVTTFIDARDVAEVAVGIIRDPAPHTGQTYVLTGPEPLTFYDVADEFSEVMGRDIKYANPSYPAYWNRMIRRGLTWDVLGFMTVVYWLSRTGKNAQQTDTLPKMLGREPTKMKQFIEDYLPHWENRDWT
jgi:uncharacterized protein YbjT (DUF2867 family)